MTTAPLPSTLPKGITLKDLARYARLTEGVKALEDEKKVLNAKIKMAYDQAKIVKGVFVYPSAAGNLIVDLGQRFGVDTKMLTEDYPYDERPEFYTPQIDVKAKVPADIVEKYRTVPTPSLSVKKS